VDQVKIDVPQTTRSYRFADRLSDARVAVVELELGGVENGRPRDVLGGAEIEDSTSDVRFIFVPFCRVLENI
jgi:hypothetical protein